MKKKNRAIVLLSFLLFQGILAVKFKEDIINKEHLNELHEALLTNEKITLQTLLSFGYQLKEISEIASKIGENGIANEVIYKDVMIEIAKKMPYEQTSEQKKEVKPWPPVFYIDGPHIQPNNQNQEETSESYHSEQDEAVNLLHQPEMVIQKNADETDENNNEEEQSSITRFLYILNKPYTKIFISMLLVGIILKIISSAIG